VGSSRIAELAKDLHISESCLRNWLTQADADELASEALQVVLHLTPEHNQPSAPDQHPAEDRDTDTAKRPAG
jgi:transposase-like protein